MDTVLLTISALVGIVVASGFLACGSGAWSVATLVTGNTFLDDAILVRLGGEPGLMAISSIWPISCFCLLWACWASGWVWSSIHPSC